MKNKKFTHFLILCAAALIVLILASALFIWFHDREKSLPKLYFEGNIMEMTDKKDIRTISVSYVDGDTTFAGYAALKVQGTSSLMYQKKNYTINFYQDEALREKMAVDVGWGPQTEYCLKANWIDQTHARNVVTARLAAEVQAQYGLFEDTPHNGTIDGFPVEIYSNGKFWGLYTFNIPKADWLFAMDAEDPNHIVLCGEDWDPPAMFEALPTEDMWAVEVGPEDGSALKKAEPLFDFVINSSDAEFRENFTHHMDLDSALNYYVLVDLAYLRDNTGKNMLLATYDGSYWYPSLYDLDTSWGTSWDGQELYPYDVSPFSYHESRLLTRLAEVFPKEVAERYLALRQTTLTKEHILEEFDVFTEPIPLFTLLRERVKWGPSIPGYPISQIEDYLDSVLPMLDAKYTQMAAG